jgi:molybdopterin converting factor small subunit
MQVEIRLWGNIGYYLPEGRGSFSLKKSFDKETTIRELVGVLRLPKDLTFIITVNSRIVEGDYTLKDGDQVALFRPSSGG